MQSQPQRPVLTPQKLPSKFALKSIALDKANPKERLYNEGIELLKQKQASLIEARKRLKVNAAKDLAADPDNILLQNKFAQALRASRVSTFDFKETLKKSFRIEGDTILYMSVPIAQLFEGDSPNAYEQVAGAIGPDHSPVYKRVTLDGQSSKDYVMVNGAMIRRIAFRGITPLENQQRVNGQPLTPALSGALSQKSPGIHFNPNGTSKVRSDMNKSDVNFLQSLGSIEANQFPAQNRDLLAFTQIRNGVSKVLSATSTPKAITSNHGAGFGQFGTVTIDLAKVPTQNILYHYNVELFETGRVKAMIQKINEQSIINSLEKGVEINQKKIQEQALSTINETKISDDVTRGNLSFIRNREILFTSLPLNSVTAYTPSASKVAFENAYRTAFKAEVNKVKDYHIFKNVKDDPMTDLDAYIDFYLDKYIGDYSPVVRSNDVHQEVMDYLKDLQRRARSKPAVVGGFTYTRR